MKKNLWIIGISLAIIFILMIIFVFTKGHTTISYKPKKVYHFAESNFYKDYYNTNDVIIVDFWATWCEPCIKEFPSIINFVKKYDDTNVKFVSISVDDDTLALKKFLERNLSFKEKDITLKNFNEIDAIVANLKLEDSYVSQTYFKIKSKQIPYLIVIKNKKILYESKGNLDTIKLKNVIESNIKKGSN